LELRLDRPWLGAQPWKDWLGVLAEIVLPCDAPRHITVPPMSDAWLDQYNAEHPKHSD
jgi:hypothetical protein